jgi:hypothetical protein
MHQRAVMAVFVISNTYVMLATIEGTCEAANWVLEDHKLLKHASDSLCHVIIHRGLPADHAADISLLPELVQSNLALRLP